MIFILAFCGLLQNPVVVTVIDGYVAINDGAFSDCVSLKDIYYTGNTSEWSHINIHSSFNTWVNATIHCNYSI